MKINEVCKLTGLTAKTIRFYEAKGLISPTSDERDGKRWRDYSERDVVLLGAISELRRALFTINDIKEMLDHPDELTAVVSRHGRSLDRLHDQLVGLRAAFRSGEVARAGDVLELAGALHSAAAELPLPEIDMNPHFRHLDELEAELSPAPRRIRTKVFTRGYIIFAAVLLALSAAAGALAWLFGTVEYGGERLRIASRDAEGRYTVVTLRSAEDGERGVNLFTYDIWSVETALEYGYQIPDDAATILEVRSAAFVQSGGLVTSYDLVVYGREDGSAVALMWHDGEEIARSESEYAELVEFSDAEAAGVLALIRDGNSIASPRDVTLTALVASAVILLLTAGARMIVPVFSGGGNRTLEMATMQGIGGIQAGERSTAFEQVNASPMEKGYVIRDDHDGEL